MRYVCETAVNVSKCLLLISELIDGGWVTSGTEQSIYGTPFEYHGPRTRATLDALLLSLAALAACGVSPSSLSLS